MRNIEGRYRQDAQEKKFGIFQLVVSSILLLLLVTAFLQDHMMGIFIVLMHPLVLKSGRVLLVFFLQFPYLVVQVLPR